MAVLVPDAYTQVLSTRGGAYLSLSLTNAGPGAMLGLMLEAQVTPNGPWSVVASEPVDYLALPDILRGAYSSDGGSVANLSAGATATINLAASSVYAVRLSALGDGCNVIAAGIQTARGAGVVNLPATRSSGALRPIGGNTVVVLTGSTGGNGWVSDIQFPAAADFVAVQFIYANVSTTTPLTINRARAVGVPAHYSNSGTTPFGPAQANLAVDVTFNGAAGVTIPVATQGPAGASNVIPTLYVSDICPISSVARTDGGAAKLVRVRTHFPDGTPMPTVGTSVIQGVNTYEGSQGLQFGYITQPVALANLETTGWAPGTDGGAFMPVGVIFHYAKPARELAAFGDSLLQGFGATGVKNGWPSVAASLGWKNSDTILTAVNMGNSGQKHAASHATLLEYLRVRKPQFAAFKSWSPNDVDGSFVPTRAIMDECWARTLLAVETCQQAGVTPLVLTNTAITSYNSTHKALVNLQNARTLQLPSNVLVLDVAGLLNLSGNLNPAYDSGDGLHWNQAGHDLVGRAAVTLLK